MGFFKSISHAFSGAVKAVSHTVTNPARFTTAVLTGGASVVAPKVFKPLTGAVQNTLFNPGTLSKVAGLAVGGGLPSLAIPKMGGSAMGLNLGGLLQGASSFLSGLNLGGTPGGGGYQANFGDYGMGTGAPFGGDVTTVMSKRPQYGSTLPGPSAPLGILRGVGKRFFDKYPNLATAIQGYRNMGKNITRAKLWSLMKRFGPEFLITAGILSAAAISELLQAGPGHRRMNPGNVKALRRSLRRLESFHHLCVRVDKLRRPTRRKAGKSQNATQFVRQG